MDRSEQENNYFKKYLKYKHKYLDLKKQIGGVEWCDNCNTCTIEPNKGNTHVFSQGMCNKCRCTKRSGC